MRNPCNIQSERIPGQLNTVLEGPDQLDQVLSAHLAQVNRASLLYEPGLLRLTLSVFLSFFFFFFFLISAAKSLGN